MSLRYLFDPNKQFQDRNGVNNVGGFLRVYIDGTDDRAITYKDFNGTFNEADIMLDTDGRAVVIVDDSLTFRIEVYERDGALQWTVTHFTARGEGGGSSTPVSVEGTDDEIDVDENTQGGIKHFVLSLSSTIKNAISTLSANLSSIALAVNGKKDRQNPVFIESSNIKTVKTFSQDENGNISIDFDDIAFPDWTSAINSAFILCEPKENKKTTIEGNEGSNTYYPTIKALVDYLDRRLQNLGGKLITDNGNPFISSSDLPSSTPYGGVTIADKDYAYVQGTGFAERWSATVTGSSVAWVNEYTINIPVFTPEQQAAIDSGVTAEMLGTFLTKTGDGSNVTAAFTAAGNRTNISTGEKLSVIFGKIAKWFADLKAVAFSGSYRDLSNKPTIGSGTLTIQKNGTNVATFGANQTGNTTANIAVPTKTSELTNDSNFLTTSGNGSNVTSTFTKNASDTSGMTSGRKLSELFKAISDFFASLKSVAFSGSYNDLSNKPTIPAAANNGVLTIKQNGTSKGTFSANQSSNTEINVTDTTYESKSASSGGTALSLVTTGEKYNWNAKQAALPTSGTASGTYAININGNAATASAAAYANDAAHANNADSAVTSALAAAANKLSSTYGFTDVPIYFNTNGTPSRCFSISNRQRLYETITDNATGFAITHNITGSEHAAAYESQPGSYFKYHVKLRNGTISILYRWSSNWNTILSEAKFNGRIIWSRLTGSSSSNVDVHDIEKYFHDYPTGSDMIIGSFDLSTQQSFQNITAQGLMIIDGYNSGALMLGTRMMLKFDMCFIKSSGQNTSMNAVIDSELYVMGT